MRVDKLKKYFFVDTYLIYRRLVSINIFNHAFSFQPKQNNLKLPNKCEMNIEYIQFNKSRSKDQILHMNHIHVFPT